MDYANTSMDAVAALAGVSKLTVYSHFTDKETLFSAAISPSAPNNCRTCFLNCLTACRLKGAARTSAGAFIPADQQRGVAEPASIDDDPGQSGPEAVADLL
jgi:hypothetical protein